MTKLTFIELDIKIAGVRKINLAMSKIFIVSLPRTGTTSICFQFLQWGFATAHTAFTRASFDAATVVADAPVFCDFPFLDQHYPGSRFVYIDRPLNSWLGSIAGFLPKAIPKIDSNAKGFNPVISRVYSHVFQLGELESGQAPTEAHLSKCYFDHREKVFNYFARREKDFLCVALGADDTPDKLAEFCGVDKSLVPTQLPQLNANGKIIAWDKVRHPQKIGSQLSGEFRRQYFSIDGV